MKGKVVKNCFHSVCEKEVRLVGLKIWTSQKETVGTLKIHYWQNEQTMYRAKIQMLVQLMCFQSKLYNEYRKVFVAIQIKLIQPPPCTLLSLCTSAEMTLPLVLSGPEGQQCRSSSGLLGLGLWSQLTSTPNPVLGGAVFLCLVQPPWHGCLLGMYWGSTSAPRQVAISVIGGAHLDFWAFNKYYNNYWFALNMPMI